MSAPALQTEANRQLHESTSPDATALLVKKGKKKSCGPRPMDLCCGCGEHSHWVNTCPNNNKNTNAKSAKGSANLVMNLVDLGSREIGQVFMATSPLGSPVTELLLDCGTFKHIFTMSESGRALSGRVCLLRARDNDEGESGGSKSNA